MFVITPRQLQRRADFYYQIGQLTTAGLSILHGLGHLKKNPPARSYRLPIGRIIEEINGGSTFSEALRKQGQWLPEFDLALIEAGEKSGRLESCFQLLGDYYADRARMANEVIHSLLYPVFLLHFAVLVFGLVAWFQPTRWKTMFLPPVALLFFGYAATIGLIFACQGRHGETWRACMEYFLKPVPLIGAGRKCLALSRLSGALEALLNAGVTIIEAWELAAIACGSPSFKRTVLAWRPELEAGKTPAEVVSAAPRFPELFASQYSAGEVSGKLDDTLKRMRQYYQEEGTRKIRAAAQWFPRLVYFLIAITIGYLVIQFYVGYFKQLNSIMGG